MTTQSVFLPLNPLAPYGLNLQTRGSQLEPGWAREAMNLVYGDTGELQVREGSQLLHSTDFSTFGNDPTIRVLFDYVDDSGTSIIVGSLTTASSAGGSATAIKLFQVDSGTAADKSGSIAWASVTAIPQFTNFNSKCIGLCVGEDLVVKSGSGDFADISFSGSEQPSSSSSALLSAYGRLWILDGQSLKYSDLLDETTFDSAYDLSAYWGGGVDVGVALAEFNGNIIVFGRSSIIVYDASLGPDNLVKTEVIAGVGCSNRDSIQQVGDDIWFLSQAGVVSLRRTVIQKSMPVDSISKNVNDYLLSKVSAMTSVSSIDSVYCPVKHLYIIAVCQTGYNNPAMFAFDTRTRFEDGSYRVTRWVGHYNAFCLQRNTGKMILGRVTRTAGSGVYTVGVCSYGSYGGDYRTYSSNDSGTHVWFKFISPWMNLGFLDPAFTSRIKILKSMSALVYTGDDVTETLDQSFYLGWDTSFETSVSDASLHFTNYVEFTSEDDDTYTTYKTPITGSGKFISFAIYSTGVSGEGTLNLMRLNSLNVQLKVGKEVL